VAILLIAGVPAPAAELAVAPVLAPVETLAERFGTLLARGLQRRRRWAEVVTPDALPPTVTAEELCGPLTDASAAALAERLGTPFLVRCGIVPDGRLAVAQLYDLRGPWLVAQASERAANSAALLALADQLAGRLEPCWPMEARATRAGDDVKLDRGHLHGLRRGNTLWLVSWPRRDELGQYSRPVAVVRLTGVHPRSANAVIEFAGPDLDEAAELLAVRPAHLAAPPQQWSPDGFWLERAPDGGWQPTVWFDWRRVTAPEVALGRWLLPGQLVHDRDPQHQVQLLDASALLQLSPPGPLRVGQPWTATLATLPAPSELWLVSPEAAATSLLAWRSAESAEPVVVHGLAGPAVGVWTFLVHRAAGHERWDGRVEFVVVR